MSTVSTHVLDSTLGRPAVNVPVRLEYLGSGPLRTSAGGDDGPAQVAAAVTDAGGRVSELGPGGLRPGIYRIVFDTAAYFAHSGQRAFYPEVAVSFVVDSADGHYHVPLVLSPFAYATYRGS
jgi:5-hydroxyisourate hydrolase